MHLIFLNEEIKMILTRSFIDQYTAIKTHHLVFLCSAQKKRNLSWCCLNKKTFFFALIIVKILVCSGE